MLNHQRKTTKRETRADLLVCITSFRFVSRALGQSRDCPNAHEATLKYMIKLHQCSTTTKLNKAQPCACFLRSELCIPTRVLHSTGCLDELRGRSVSQDKKTPGLLHQCQFSNRTLCLNRKSTGWEKPRQRLADAETSGPPTGQYVLSRAVFMQHAVGSQAAKESDEWRFDMMCSEGYWICKHVIWQ